MKIDKARLRKWRENTLPVRSVDEFRKQYLQDWKNKCIPGPCSGCGDTDHWWPDCPKAKELNAPDKD